MRYYNNQNKQYILRLTIFLYYRYKSDEIINNRPTAAKFCYCMRPSVIGGVVHVVVCNNVHKYWYLNLHIKHHPYVSIRIVCVYNYSTSHYILHNIVSNLVFLVVIFFLSILPPYSSHKKRFNIRYLMFTKNGSQLNLGIYIYF